MRILLLLCCLPLAACTTDSTIRDDGSQVTVKRFAGIPYYEEDTTTKTGPVDGGARPL